MKRVALLVMCAVAAAVIGGFSTPASAARTWTVIAGGGTRDAAVVSNFFHPRTIEISVGDTVRWQFQGFHHVAFTGGQPPPRDILQVGSDSVMNPAVAFPAGGKTYAGTGYRNSGLPPDDPAAAAKFGYALTFTKAGTYQYFCVLHLPAMTGTVVVKASAMGSPAAAAQKGRSEQAATIKAGQAAWAAYKTEKQGATVVVPILGNPRQGWTLLRFSPRPIEVSPGTTVTWVNRDPSEIHTVTFLGGTPAPEFIIPQPRAQGPPKLVVNPKVRTPVGNGKAYDGMGYVNSGILVSPQSPAPLPKSFSLTFTKTGQYPYICVVHVQAGHVSSVIVK